ncbi:hypothetical protein [Adhaeretor mobilis]|uniref:Uncharacterized protein n=1 Tax=Adhaeretor mobilis TaxID=1930276 RepID=A0A517MY19_9BACT|nr:hypothetical protein [Adhaeretor mobilis]QDS99778.1 hypothetical protein HG15A2_31090 [Adhaeretor mobilis]
METWLQPNRRVLTLAMVPAGLLAVIGALLWLTFSATLLKILAGCLVVLGLIMLFGLASQLRRPRISYDSGQVRFHLRARQPVAVPVEHVEAFFLGQGPASLPVGAGKSTETVNLVARLSQKAPEWAEVEVKQALGNWKEGYATVRGTWCEPLTPDLLRFLNRRLREVSEANAAQEKSSQEQSKPVDSGDAART